MPHPLALFLDLLMHEPAYYLSVVVAAVVSVVLHELAHGFCALWQGDDTPRVSGHITWNPLVHMGGLSLVLLFVVGIAFGQTPVTPSRFRSRYGRALVAAAGPATNLVLALIGLTAFGLWVQAAGVRTVGAAGILQQFLFLFGLINIVLGIFNLLPIPPLDGSSILADVSPGFRRLKNDPDKRPVFLVVFLAVFLLAPELFRFARGAADAWLALLGVV